MEYIIEEIQDFIPALEAMEEELKAYTLNLADSANTEKFYNNYKNQLAPDIETGHGFSFIPKLEIEPNYDMAVTFKIGFEVTPLVPGDIKPGVLVLGVLTQRIIFNEYNDKAANFFVQSWLPILAGIKGFTGTPYPNFIGMWEDYNS